MDPNTIQVRSDAMKNAAKLIAQSEAPSYQASAFPEIANTYKGAYQAEIAKPMADAAVYNSGVTIDRQVADLKMAQADSESKTDKSKYQRVKRKDGGFGFYDPNGQEISAYQYANAIGSTPAEVLSDSENPIDIGYIQDYDDLNTYLQASLAKNSDENAKAVWDEMNRIVYEDTGVKLWTLTPQQVIDSFKKNYPTVYGTKNRGIPVGQLAMPRVGSGDSLDSLMSQVGQ